MKIAVATICPEPRQRAILDVSWPTWTVYAKRHDLPIIVVTQPPHPQYVYWGKYFLLTDPAFREFDAVVILDNDIIINPESPLITDGWDPAKVGMIDEREQFGWSDEYVADYYAHYELDVPPALEETRVLNGGVIVYGREHLALFEQLFAHWRAWRREAGELKRKAAPFKYANDQPHVSLALQLANRAQTLPGAFNRLWWSWYRQHGLLPWRAFQIYAKASSLLEKAAPRVLADWVARPGADALERAVRECNFLHVAGSKSPIWLFAHRRSD